MRISIDIELTNRCNAHCHFCPRDQTPHQGLMSPEVFAQALRRAVEFRDGLPEGQEAAINMCGLGEPLLNKHAPEFVRQARDEGFYVGMSSNAALLDEKRGRALLDAGLQRILVNAGDRDEEYEQVYTLPFQRTYDNVVRFLDMAGDACEVHIVIVDHRYDADHVAAMKEFWRAAGINSFVSYSVINRGGALFVDHMQYEQYPESAEARGLLTVDGRAPLCAAPFTSNFVGYDGLYYLCCSDWRKEAPVGSVFDESFESVVLPKVRHLLSREPVCKTCNLDPINMVTEELRAVASGDADQSSVDKMVGDLVSSTALMHAALSSVMAQLAHESPAPEKRRIPVRAV